jgi:hypothetical protein
MSHNIRRRQCVRGGGALKKAYVAVISLIAIFTLLGVPAATAAKPPKPLVVPNLDLDATELSFCVTKSGGIKFNTKANCGSKAKEVVLLTSNFESYLSNGINDCWQRYFDAGNAQVLWHIKTERDDFESATGCVVEDIKNEANIEFMVAAGFPVIENYTLSSLLPPCEGEKSDSPNGLGYLGGEGCSALFVIEIANPLWISNVSDGQAWFCNVRSKEALQAIGRVTARKGRYLAWGNYSISHEGAWAGVGVGYTQVRGNCDEPGTFYSSLYAGFSLDPEFLIAEGILDDGLATYWGW